MQRRFRIGLSFLFISLLPISFFNCAKTDNSQILAEYSKGSKSNTEGQYQEVANPVVNSPSPTSTASTSPTTPSASATPSASVTPSPTMSSAPTATPTSTPTATAASCQVNFSATSFDVFTESWTTTATMSGGITRVKGQCGSKVLQELTSTSPSFTYIANTFSQIGINNCTFTGYTAANIATQCTSYNPINFTMASRRDLAPGFELRPGQTMQVAGGFVLSFSSNGVLALTQMGSESWNAGVSFTNQYCLTPQCRAVFQNDGNWVIYDDRGNPHWNSETGGRVGANTRLILRNGFPFLEIIDTVTGQTLWNQTQPGQIRNYE